MNKQSLSFTTLIVGVALIIGAWVAYTNFSKPMAEEADASKSWPTAPGVVTSSDIHQSESDGTTMYSAEISYDFMVEGKTFSGHRITLNSGNSSTSSLRSVKKDLKKYPVDAAVTVYYDPELPNNAVLQPGADFFTYIIKYAPFLLGFVGVLLLMQMFKKIGILLLALFVAGRK